MKTHVNIPIFIPHLGCPHNCVFCSQRKISGHEKADFSAVGCEIETALSTVKDGQEAQIAYFGGSFTGIDRGDMIYLLTIAKKFIDAGRVKSIRLSTRPDYIDEEILDILEKYGVRSIELGLQSMNDRVLAICERGHTAECGERACEIIKARGFELIGQMMTGLPGSSFDDDVMTARKIAALCDGARIYPTVVFRGTKLCDMAESGEYEMPTEEELVERTVGALREFYKAGKPVIRLGLQASDGVLDEESVYSDTYSPAMGEICYSRLYRELIEEKIPAGAQDVEIRVAVRALSKAIGQRGENKKYLIEKYGLRRVRFIGDTTLSDYDVKINKWENKSDET
ncbi:MAG: radical SAM protein [Clostridia bacterium]|nr:radical SAM protein [Clostridia bacterium]